MATDPGAHATDPITSLIDSVADSWTHAMSGAQRSLDGTSTVSDVLEDVLECSIRASRIGVDLLRSFGLLPPAATRQPNPTVVTVEVPVEPVAFSAATTLTCSDLRAIGFGERYKIPADPRWELVKIGAPAPGTNGLMIVPVTVSFANVGRFERQRTMVYEGTITAGPPVAGARPWRVVVRVPKPAQ